MKTRQERETVIIFNRFTDQAIITTTDPVVAKKLLKRLGETTEIRGEQRDPYSWRWEGPASLVPLPIKRTRKARVSGENPGVSGDKIAAEG